MTPKSTVLAAAIVAAALAVPGGLAQAAPIAPVQPAAGKANLTPVYYRHGHYYHRPYRYHRRYGHYWRRPYNYGAYAYQPESDAGSYSYLPRRQNWYHYPVYCPYYRSQNLWWCH